MSKPPTQVPIASPSSHGSTPAASAGREPAADRRHGHRQRRGTAACSSSPASPANTRTRSPARPATARSRSVPSCHAANTNTTDETTTKTTASARDIAPRGISRIAVRGLSASYDASASRLNPIAALRAATIATTIQATRQADDGVRPVADPVQREERAGQRKRQREDRVAEAHEAGVGSQAVHSSHDKGGQGARCRVPRAIDSQPMSDAGFRSPGILPHPRRRRGTRTASSSARLPGAIEPSSRRIPARRRRQRRARERSGRPATSGASRRTAAISSNRFEALDAGQAVGADRHPDARLVEPLDRRHAGAGPRVAARAGDDRRAAPPPGAPVRRRSDCTPCTASRRAFEQPQPVEVLDRPARRAAATPGSRRRAISSSVAPRAACRREELDLLAPTRRDECCSGASALAARDRAQQRRRHRIRRVRHHATAAATRSASAPSSCRCASATTAPGSATRKPEQLAKDRRRQLAVEQRRRRSRACW